MRLVTTFALAGALICSACGGGGNGGEPSLVVSARSIKALDFRWQAVPGATLYRLLEDVDGDTGPQVEQPIRELPVGQQSVTLDDVFLPARVNARYRLQVCRGTDCATSASVGIDGLDSGIGFFKASNPAAGDQFGEGLAISADGSTLAVGAHKEDGTNGGVDSTPVRGAADAEIGAVYVFRRGSSGWVQEAYIKPSHTELVSEFGYRLALSGNGSRLLVGAPSESSGGTGVGADPQTPGPFSGGAAYVFDRGPDDRWQQSGFLKPTVVDVAFQFGSAVALSRNGEWAAVGQPYSDDGGSVFVFQHASGAWTLRGELRDASIQNENAFGQQLAFDPDGRTLAIGAPRTGTPPDWAGCDGNTFQHGAVFLFARDAGDAWQPLGAVQSPQPSCFFGASVALSSGGQTLVVGESGWVTGNTPSLGKVHLFQRQADGWVHGQSLPSPLNGANGRFADHVAISDNGDVLAVANPFESSAGSGLTAPPVMDGRTDYSGSVYLFRRSGDGAWSPAVPVKASNSRSEFYFGWSLAMSASGDLLAVSGGDNSASSGIGGSQTDTSAHWAGAVYLY